MNEGLIPKIIRIATRKSPLALWQAEMVGKFLKNIDDSINIEFVKITTSGDKILDKPLYDIGGKSLFLKELEMALLKKDCDIAVHSMKDMPSEIQDNLEIGAILKREDCRDVLISKKYKSLANFAPGSSIGTSSIRRICNLKHDYKNLEIKNIRGNIDTRINKVIGNEIDGIVIAAAGVKRLGLQNHIAEYMNEKIWIPAIGQGAIGVELRKDDKIMKNLIKKLNDNKTSVCVNLERQLSKYFQASCNTPLAALASIDNDKVKLFSMIGSIDGKQKIYHEENALLKDSRDLGTKVAIELEKKGARDLL